MKGFVLIFISLFLITSINACSVGNQSQNTPNNNHSSSKAKDTIDTSSWFDSKQPQDNLYDKDPPSKKQMKEVKDWWSYTVNRNAHVPATLKEWFPKPFKVKGELVKRWSHNIILREGDTGSLGDGPTPLGLVLVSGYEIVETRQKLKGLLNMETGEISEGNYNNYAGPTDGEYVFGDTYEKGGSMPCYCWRLSDRKVLWEQCCGSIDHGFQIMNGCLLFFTPIGDFRRLDPKTGQIVWELKPSSPLLYHFRCKTNNYIFVVAELNDKSSKGLFRIKPDDGEVTPIKVSKNDIVGMASFGNYLIALTSDNSLLKIDEKSAVEVESAKIKTEHTSKSLSRTIENDGDKIKVSIRSFGADKDEVDESYLIDPANLNNQMENTRGYYIFNNSLIHRDDKTIQGLDPNTLKPLWWMNLEKDGLKGAWVVWCDWRGVLVQTTDTISCYSIVK